MIAACLCGLFYGALLHAVWQKEMHRLRLRRLLGAVEGCIGDWSFVEPSACDCGCAGCQDEAGVG